MNRKIMSVMLTLILLGNQRGTVHAFDFLEASTKNRTLVICPLPKF